MTQQRTAIIQCRLTPQEKEAFCKAAATQKRRWYGSKTPSEVMRELILEFTKQHLPEDGA